VVLDARSVEDPSHVVASPVKDPDHFGYAQYKLRRRAKQGA